MLGSLEFISHLIALAAAGAASYLWLQSTKVSVPNSFGVVTADMNYSSGDETPEKKWAREISDKNRRAAIATAISVGAQGAAVLFALMK